MINLEEVLTKPVPVDPTYSCEVSFLTHFPTSIPVTGSVIKAMETLDDNTVQLYLCRAFHKVWEGKCPTDTSHAALNKLITPGCAKIWYDHTYYMRNVIKNVINLWENSLIIRLTNAIGADVIARDWSMRHRISTYTRAWCGQYLRHQAGEYGMLIEWEEFVEEMKRTQCNPNKLWTDAWGMFEEVGLEAYHEAEPPVYEEAEEPKREFMGCNGLREIVTGPRGNRWPLTRNKKGKK